MRIRSSCSRGRAAALAVLLPLLAAAGAVPARADTPAPRRGRAVVPNSRPAWAQPSADRGEAAASSPVTARVYLAGRDRRGLEEYARQVSDPSSRSYGAYLTAAALEARFGSGEEQHGRVREWLASAGLRVVAETGHYLAVQGDAAGAQRAFGTALHEYARDGRTYRAPAGEVSVPAGLAEDVLSVTGLTTSPSRVSPGSGGRRDTLPGPGGAFANSGPFSDFFGARPAAGTPAAYGAVRPYVIKGLDGAALRGAYGAASTGLTGSGVTVAVVDAYDSPTIGDDVTRYAAGHGDAPYGRDQLLRFDPAVWTHTADPSVDPEGCGAAGWYGEQTLDIEAVHAVAPAADIAYVGAASCYDQDLIDALDRVVDRHLADIVSNSWGEPENASDPAFDRVYQQLFQRGAATGIGLYFSSGDDGDELDNSGTKQTDMPASLPWATAVGGTSLALRQDGGYRFETGWGTLKSVLSADGTSWVDLPGAFNGGAGGGTSARFPQPPYQRGVVPAALAGANGGRNRVVPDIAAVADPNTGFLVGQTQAFPDGTVRYAEYRIGGTSLACPVIAALQALAQQAKGSPIGFANPTVYDRYRSGAFHDVTDHPLGAGTELAQVRVDFANGVDAAGGTVVSLRTMGHDTSLAATEGYDAVTGVGSPTARYLTSYARPFHGLPGRTAPAE
ncbi:protease pro-enzyme activation domain-containing protein [Kitasatospora sp. NPDC059571]|uniref:S53 family peptidase n=1 Tax=Kitasatospora sp. NPDC059571 TaxID=3346871 RepID=UPI0036A91BFC